MLYEVITILPIRIIEKTLLYGGVSMSGYDEKNEDIVLSIKERINEITSGEAGMLVNLNGVAYPEGGRGSSHSMISVSCLFINEEGSVCADLFRTGTAGFTECVCGSVISTIGKRGSYNFV